MMPEVSVAAGNPLDVYRAAATREWELVHTDIDIRFQIAQRTATATADLVLHPYYYETDSVMLDARSMRIESVTGEGNKPLSWRYDTSQLRIHLPRRYRQRDTLRLTIRYTAMPYAFAAGGSSAITEDRGLYFVNADGAEPYQPVQIWTQGETSANSHWFPTFDHPNFRSAFRITMHVPDSFRTLSNGTLAATRPEPGGMRADTWVQQQPIPPYLVMMAAGNFAVSADTCKGKEVSYYVPQPYGPYARDIFRNTPEMMGYFSELLGVDYPWDKYSQVVGYDYVSGAMENVSASLFGAFNLKDRRQLADDNNDYIVAHELFHQWFGDYVTAESWSNLTLNESFADYSEHLWATHKYGKAAGQLVWQQGLNKYLGQAAWSDPPLIRFHYRTQEDMFDRVSYSKGGLILHYLRQLTGDAAFFDALHLYLTQNAGRSAEATQLRLAVEQVTGRDWNWFFDQWYYRGGHPVLDITYSYDDRQQQLLVKVIQAQPDSVGLYRLPLKMQVLTESSVRTDHRLLQRKEETFAYPYENGKRPVIVLDAGHWLPGVINDRKEAWQWQLQYRFSGDRLSKAQALKGCMAMRGNDTALAMLTDALSDKDPYLRQLAIGSRDPGSEKLPASWIAALGRIAAADPDNKARAAALRVLGALENEAYTSTYEQAVTDSSYKVAAAGLYALDRVNHKRALEYARSLEPGRMMGNALLYQAALVIAREGLAGDEDFFADKTLQLFENDRAAFLGAVQEYLVHAKDDGVFRRGIERLQQLAVRKAASREGLYAGAVLYHTAQHAAKQAKIASEKSTSGGWKARGDSAAAAWDAYKRSVQDEALKAELSKIEKE